MAKFKDQFIAGARAQGYAEKIARKLFEDMEYFAGYGFNKSHSTAYALVTYQTAWLKAHYQVEFTAANLTVESGNTDKIKEFVDEARRSGMAILPPSVNLSQRYFSVEGKSIRYGLGAIKGVGARAADAIAAERRRGGAFQSLEDLCERLDGNLLNKAALEALVQAGALDGMARTRAGNLAAIESALRSSAAAREDRRRGQKMLFAAPQFVAQAAGEETAAEWPEHDRLAREKESLGFYLSGHPFERRGPFLRRIAGQTTKSLAQLEPGTSVRVAGMISSVRVMQIKQGKNAGQKMARFQLEDLDGQVAVTCFARAYATMKDRIVDDGTGEDRSILLDQLEPANEVVRREVAGLVLHLRGNLATDGNLERIAETLSQHRGQQHLHLDVDDGSDCYRVRSDEGVRVTEGLLDDLALLVGSQNMFFTRT
jgi:DNA polymerase-3 subunit alpha